MYVSLDRACRRCVGIWVAYLLCMGIAFGQKTAIDRDEYADTFLALRSQVRDYERDPANRYTYCVRSTATYECLSYGTDGAVRRTRTGALAHGTGFAYREQGGETYLLTNQHVAEWPSVTDSEHKVDDVPAGCKRISDSLKIVDNEEDDYGADDIPLSRVVSDDALDASVVKAKGKLRIMPYRIGRSALVTTGDVVLVRGFPLGAFQAANTGKVVNPVDHDTYKDWDHTDFVIDAPLSTGNSGSPVLAVSRRTGEYELVGMFHAGYLRATSLNAVVGIDQLRDLMMTLKRSPRGKDTSERASAPLLREEVERALAQPGFVPYVGLGPLLVAVRQVSGMLLYEVYSRRFPFEDRRLLVLLDQQAGDSFGQLFEAWFGNERGLKHQPLASLDPDVAAQVQLVLRRLQSISVGIVRFRQLSEKAASSRDAVTGRATLQRTLSREAQGDADLAQSLAELAERLGPRAGDQAVTMTALLSNLPTRLNQPTAPAGDPNRQANRSQSKE